MKTNNLITSREDLAEIVEASKKLEAVALDTEFVWERTYYPKLGLVQIGLSEEECYLIDVPAMNDLSPLAELLSEDSVVKILHDAQQDLMILKGATGALPRNIFDTRCAAGFAGLSSTLSLRDLLKAVINVELDKSETRTNWLQRPLSDEQISYAIEDVKYLPKVRKLLISNLKDEHYIEWMAEELSVYDDPSLYEEKDPYLQFEKVKGVGRLKGVERAILRELAAWRENEARKRDRPKGHVVADEALVAIAKRRPASLEKLKGIRGLNGREVDRYGIKLIEQVVKGLSSSWGSENNQKQMYNDDEVLNARVDFALACLKGKSLSEGIDQALVASRSDVASLVYNDHEKSGDNHRLLKGWRKVFIGEELQELLAGRHALRIDIATGLPKLEE